MSNNTISSPDSAELASLLEVHSGKRKPLRRLLWVALFLALLGGAWAYWQGQQKNAARGPAFSTTAVKRGDIQLIVTATGNLEPTNEVTVGSELSGTTLEVYVDTNDHVTKGQPLAKLDTTKLEQQTASYRASLLAAQASVAQAEATLKEAEAAFKRAQDLRRLSNGKLPSQADYDSAEATALSAKASLLAAQASVAQSTANLQTYETDLGKSVIKSPIDGIVLTRDLEPGQTVAASFTAPELFVLAEKLEHMKLIVAVAEADIGRVQKDNSANFTVDAWPNRTFSAKVLKVAYGSEVVDNVVTYETELQVSNDDLSLRPGMTATANINVAESKNTLLVPVAALRFKPTSGEGKSAAEEKSFIQSLMPRPPRRASGKPTAEETAPSEKLPDGSARIWVLGEDNQPRPLLVKVGLSDGRFTEVSGEGVAEGLPVITRMSQQP